MDSQYGMTRIDTVIRVKSYFCNFKKENITSQILQFLIEFLVILGLLLTQTSKNR